MRHAAEFRFSEELNDFLPPARRKRSFTRGFDGTPAVKDTIESLGVPHTEVDLILVDGRSVRFAHRLHGGERVAVYPTRGHWVRATEPPRQVEEVVSALSLQRDLRPFTRCTICNAALRHVERSTVAGRVPPRVYARFRRFVECDGCGRIYWRGSHYRRLATLAGALQPQRGQSEDVP